MLQVVCDSDMMDDNTTLALTGEEGASFDVHLMTEQYGVPSHGDK